MQKGKLLGCENEAGGGGGAKKTYLCLIFSGFSLLLQQGLSFFAKLVQIVNIMKIRKGTLKAEQTQTFPQGQVLWARAGYG